MIAYKLKENNSNLNAGRLFAQMNNYVILLATCTEGQSFYDSWTFNRLKNMGLLEEVCIEDEKWIHPHLYKPIKQLLKQEGG